MLYHFKRASQPEERKEGFKISFSESLKSEILSFHEQAREYVPRCPVAMNSKELWWRTDLINSRVNVMRWQEMMCFKIDETPAKNGVSSSCYRRSEIRRGFHVRSERADRVQWWSERMAGIYRVMNGAIYVNKKSYLEPEGCFLKVVCVGGVRDWTR